MALDLPEVWWLRIWVWGGLGFRPWSHFKEAFQSLDLWLLLLDWCEEVALPGIGEAF